MPSIDVMDVDYPQRDSLDDNLNTVSQDSLDKVHKAVYPARRRRLRAGHSSRAPPSH